LGKMKIDSVNLFLTKMRLRNPFRTSFGVEQDATILLVNLKAGDRVGWGECVAREGPWYSGETINTSEYLIKNFIGPWLKETDLKHPSEYSDLTKSIRGNQMTKACVEDALWDLYGKIKNQSVHELIGGGKKKIPSGISLGIQEDTTTLVKKIEEALERKYQRIKLKIEPGMDNNVLKQVRDHFPEINLMVDANSAYRIKDKDIFVKMDRFDLMMIEQPLQYYDIIDHAKLQKEISTPICLDESIKCVDDARVAIEIDATRIINVKPARVGGITETLKIHELALETKIPLWCGGMLETGIGRAKNVAVSCLDSFTLPNDISESARYYSDYIIEPIFVLNSDGTLSLPEKGPGLGVEIKEDVIKQKTIRKVEV
jgi:O-succinylbenzoate synthase